MIYELRIYTMHPGKMEAIRNRFASHTLGIFRRMGMQVYDFWEDAGEERKLYYVMQYESLEQRNKLWEQFRADEEWVEVKRQSELDGEIVAGIETIFMKRADFFKSPAID